MTQQREFTLTEDHVKLLRAANVRWEDCEFGAPSIDCKRPYGNSSVELDVAELLGWKVDDRVGLTDQQREHAYTFHRETELALQVTLATGQMIPGRYVQAKQYDYRSWRLAEATP